MIESRVAAKPARQPVSCHQAEGERRDRRSEGVAGDRQDAQGNRDRPEARRCENDDCGSGHRRHRQNDDAALGARHVDRGADRRLKRNSEQAARRRHQSDIGLAPMLGRDEKHVDERPEQVSNVGCEKIDRVERIRDRDHRHQPKSGSISSPVVERGLSDIRSADDLLAMPGLGIGIFIDNRPRSAR